MEHDGDVHTDTGPVVASDPRVANDPRVVLYRALELVEDCLVDGYRSPGPLPVFSDVEPAAAEPARPPAAGSDSLEAIAAETARCLKCRLASSRKRAVPGTGARQPLVLVVGEGPGAEEDATGRPFVGPAGQLLDRMLASIGLSRDDNCFIGNVVKCRPPMNRDPAPDEQAACLPYLERQMDILRPKAVLAVGRIPAQALLGTKDGIGRLRGRVYQYRGIPVVPTYHPSALLRDESLKRPAWEDLKLLKTILDHA